MVPEDSRYKVDLFWNLEESMVTKDEANEIARRITDSLRTINKQCYLGKMYAVGSSTLEVSEVLELNGFKMKEAPIRMVPCCASGCDKLVRKEGVADRVILQLLLREALNKDDGLFKNIMIVSDNTDFKLPVGMLKDQGYKLFIAAKWSDDSTSEYQLSGDHV